MTRERLAEMLDIWVDFLSLIERGRNTGKPYRFGFEREKSVE